VKLYAESFRAGFFSCLKWNLEGLSQRTVWVNAAHAQRPLTEGKYAVKHAL
jgi:hypothetical protein